MATNELNDLPLERLCDAVMRGVVDTGRVRAIDAPHACRVMREEIAAFLRGPEYADERAVVMAGSVHAGYVVASIVASCVLKIEAARIAAPEAVSA